MVSYMEIIAKKVREELQANPTPNVRDVATLKGGCQDAVASVRRKLERYGIKSRILRLSYHAPGNSDGTHIVTSVDDYIIDPTITQFYPNIKKYVFKSDDYPLATIKSEDITSYSNFFKIKI
ncbi:MAG: hypothetical protein QMD14_02905 [Candidatus Aenigmarchaeota archaeon]|nr:hypothetical protein [Candidatus Aenigmarchaeota archaeon]